MLTTKEKQYYASLERKWRQHQVTVKRRLEKYLRRFYGKRCTDFQEECPLCQQWAAFDRLFNDQ